MVMLVGVVGGQGVKQVSVDNGKIRIVAERTNDGYGIVKVLARRGFKWLQIACWQPIARIVYDGQQGKVDWQPALRSVSFSQNSLQLSDKVLDPDGSEWHLRVTFTLKPNEPVAQIRCEWSCESDRLIRALWGPNLLVGDSAAKLWGLLPGVEFLYDGEPSSNLRDFAPPLHDRRTPNPKKLTIPLMAVTIGEGSIPLPKDADKFFCPDSLFDMPKVTVEGKKGKPNPVTVALFWNPLQLWDGERTLPSVKFESPTPEGNGHRLALFLPSCPDFVPENSDKAAKPYLLRANQTLRLEATISVKRGQILTTVRRWLKEVGGLSKPNPAPRDLEQQLALDRFGFLRTVWDEQTQK